MGSTNLIIQKVKESLGFCIACC